MLARHSWMPRISMRDGLAVSFASRSVRATQPTGNSLPQCLWGMKAKLTPGDQLSGENYPPRGQPAWRRESGIATFRRIVVLALCRACAGEKGLDGADRKSTRLNSSH